MKQLKFRQRNVEKPGFFKVFLMAIITMFAINFVQAQHSVFDIISFSDDHNILEQALVAAQLTDELEG